MSSTTKPEAIVFDLGKVLLEFDFGRATRRLAEKSPMSAGEVRKNLDQSPLLFEFETGRLNNEQFYQAVKAATGYTGSAGEFNEFFGDIFTPMDSMIRLNEELRQRGLPTYIFSNTNDLAVSFIRRTYPFFANFTDYILSYQHGAMKPAAKIYDVVEQVSGKRGAQILYLDDRAENIEAGAARGWQTILQTSPEESRAIIENLGLLNHR